VLVDVPSDVPAGAMSTLVVMQTWWPGWHVHDVQGAGVAGPVRSAGGFLSVDGVRPGATYVFSYLPARFVIGAWLSVLGVLVVVCLVWLEFNGVPAWALPVVRRNWPAWLPRPVAAGARRYANWISRTWILEASSGSSVRRISTRAKLTGADD
jgi:hypothetical protein